MLARQVKRGDGFQSVGVPLYRKECYTPERGEKSM